MIPVELPDALVLAGGLGSRLRGVVPDRQKVVATVLGRPFLGFVLAQLEAAGVRRAVLCTGHLSPSVETLGEAFGAMCLSYSNEGEPLGTGGALRRGLAFTDSSILLVVNGDSFCAADLTDLLASHRSGDSIATLLAVAVPEAGRYGLLEIGPEGLVTAFREKGLTGKGRVNAGVYVLDREVVACLPAGREISLEREVFPSLTGAGLSAYTVEAPFLDIGTPESYAEAERFFAGQVRPRDGRPFVVLDRDGTVVRHHPYLCRAEDTELLPGAGAALRELARGGFGLVLVTNQSGVGRGYFDRGAVRDVHARLAELLLGEGVILDGYFVCPHLPWDGCGCRKPRGGLLRRAAHELGFDLRETIVVGDNDGDVGLGQGVGAATILVRTGHGRDVEAAGRVYPDRVVEDLGAAAVEILAGRVRSIRPREENP